MPTSRKNRRYRITTHRAGVALKATGSAGASVRAFKRHMRLSKRFKTSDGTLRTQHPRRGAHKPKEKK